MRKLLTYLTGALALLIVTASVVSALVYATTHGTETLTNLANSTLSGIGIAIGGCLGSALILRFKAARRFISGGIKDVNPTRHFDEYSKLAERFLPISGPISGPRNPE